MKDTYSLALISTIPVVRDAAGGLWTLALWVEDLRVQQAVASRLLLVSPVATGEAPPADQAMLPADIEVLDLSTVLFDTLRERTDEFDIVQFPQEEQPRAVRLMKRLLQARRSRQQVCVLGVSSNRVRTTLMNMRLDSLRGWLRAPRALMDALRFKTMVSHFSRRCDATFVVGQGVRDALPTDVRNVHVSVASWVRRSDFEGGAERRRDGPARARHRFVIASRLERMKGVHVGIEAFALLQRQAPNGQAAHLTIYGEGPELEALQRQALHSSASQAAQAITFGGTLAYPQPFLRALAEHGYVMLPNLNDEQPRLVFDAIAAGAMALCPDRPAYRALSFPDAVYYPAGDAAALASCCERLQRLSADEDDALFRQILAVARDRTLESMHERRRQWLSELLRSRSPARAA